MTSRREMEELKKVYAEAHEQGYYFKELKGCAGCGRIESVELLIAGGHVHDGITDLESFIGAMNLGDMVNLTWPGFGATRVEACRAALKAAQEAYARREVLPE
jgi:hypothetical protein